MRDPPTVYQTLATAGVATAGRLNPNAACSLNGGLNEPIFVGRYSCFRRDDPRILSMRFQEFRGLPRTRTGLALLATALYAFFGVVRPVRAHRCQGSICSPLRQPGHGEAGGAQLRPRLVLAVRGDPGNRRHPGSYRLQPKEGRVGWSLPKSWATGTRPSQTVRPATSDSGCTSCRWLGSRLEDLPVPFLPTPWIPVQGLS